MKFFTILFLTIFLFCHEGQSGGYEIKVKLANCKNSKIFLGYYFDGKVLALDTANTDIKGRAIFSKNKTLHGGLYMLYLPSKQYIDFIIGSDQHFIIESDINNLHKAIKFKGSEENQAFQEYKEFMNKKRVWKSMLIDSIKQYKLSGKKDKLEVYRKKIDDIDREVRRYIERLSEEFPNTALSSFTQLTLGPKIPDFTQGENGVSPKDTKTLRELYYNFNKNHYWDNIHFSDSTILRTPIFKNKLDKYFSRIILQDPDTVYSESVKLIEKSRDNKSMFRYMVSYCFNNALNSKIMGMDAAFVNIAKRYYLRGEAYWIGIENLEKIREEVEKTQFNLIGMKGQELKLPTIDNEWVSLHELNAQLTILVFWEPDCGHCKKQLPQIKSQLYEKYKDRGLKVFSVYTQRKRDEWEAFVEKYELFDFINCYDPHNQSGFRQFYNVYNTPVIYLLNKNKEIIAKKVDIKTLEIIIREELKQ